MLTTQYSDVNTATNTVNIDFSLIEVKDEKVSARNLYKFLELNQSQFSRWSKKNITNNELVSENQDFWRGRLNVEGQMFEDYLLTVDFAKELSMMARTLRGKQARNYFLDCEKKAQTLQQPTQVINFTDIREVAKALLIELDGKDLIIKSKDETIAQLAPKAEFVDKTFTNGQTGLSTMKTVAHECGVSINALYKLLRDSKVWFYQLNAHGQAENAVMAKYIKSGHFEVKQFWSDRQHCYFDKIFATAKGKLLCYKLTKSDINQLIDLELA